MITFPNQFSTNLHFSLIVGVKMQSKSRFLALPIDVLLNHADSKSSIYKEKYALKLLHQFMASEHWINNKNVNNLNHGEVDELLSSFYAAIRKNNGDYLKRNSLHGIRYGLARYFKKNGLKNPDIIHDIAFNKANAVYNCVLKELKIQGKGTTRHFDEIVKSDLAKINEGLLLSTPVQLQLFIWFNIQLFLCKRGCENVDTMLKNSIVIRTNANGRRYLMKAKDELIKNRRCNELEEFGGMIYETGTSRCPVANFEKYIIKLNTLNNFLWQVPKTYFNELDTCWYQNKKHGHNKISNFMKNISGICELSKKYTNHSLRVTFISISGEKFTENEIMAISGHKSASCLGIYKRVRDETKEKMFNYVMENCAKSDCSNHTNTTKEIAIDLHDPDQTQEMINDDPFNEEDKMLVECANSAELNYNQKSLTFAPTFNNCNNITININK